MLNWLYICEFISFKNYPSVHWTNTKLENQEASIHSHSPSIQMLHYHTCMQITITAMYPSHCLICPWTVMFVSLPLGGALAAPRVVCV